MKLIIGGAYQGKLTYAIEHFQRQETDFLDGAVWEAVTRVQDNDFPQGINHLHLYIRTCLQQERDPLTEIQSLIERYPDIILISDEVGCGIVPVDPFERQYREVTGRICCYLAKEAEEVIRVTCGIGRKIKG